jgi:hypothetical protein
MLLALFALTRLVQPWDWPWATPHATIRGSTGVRVHDDSATDVFKPPKSFVHVEVVSNNNDAPVTIDSTHDDIDATGVHDVASSSTMNANVNSATTAVVPDESFVRGEHHVDNASALDSPAYYDASTGPGVANSASQDPTASLNAYNRFLQTNPTGSPTQCENDPTLSDNCYMPEIDGFKDHFTRKHGCSGLQSEYDTWLEFEIFEAGKDDKTPRGNAWFASFCYPPQDQDNYNYFCAAVKTSDSTVVAESCNDAFVRFGTPGDTITLDACDAIYEPQPDPESGNRGIDGAWLKCMDDNGISYTCGFEACWNLSVDEIIDKQGRIELKVISSPGGAPLHWESR